jgi:hypothetical protein
MPTSSSSVDAASPIEAAVTALRSAGEKGDADAVAAVLAPDVVFHSPFTDRLPFAGREDVTALHRDLFAVLTEIKTTEPLALGRGTRSFTFRARVRGVELEAILLLSFNEQAKIVDYKIFIRPIPGLMTLFAALPPRVSARRRGRVKGALLALFARPLAFVLRTVDHYVPWFL